MAAQTFIGSILDTSDKAKLHELTDYAALRQIAKDNVLKAVGLRFPLENDRYMLHIKDPRWEDADLSIKSQKDAMMQNGTVADKLKGIWQLTDKQTGQVVSESGLKTIMNVPAITQRGTFIKNGNEMTLSHAMRLNPGVYSRKTADGRYEAMFNTEQGSGLGFRVYMDPDTGVFKLKRGGVNAPLYPVLTTLGVPDDAIKNAWGEELYNVNRNDSAKAAAVKNLRAILPRINSPLPAQQDLQLQDAKTLSAADPAAVEVPGVPGALSELSKESAEILTGGKADNMSLADIAARHNVPYWKLLSEFMRGIKIEYEHTGNMHIACEITLDHLAEHPAYYTGLKAMEGKLTELEGVRKEASLKDYESSALRDDFEKLRLDPESTRLTMGTPYSSVNGELILKTSNKLLAMAKGLAEPDNRDGLEFQKVYGPGEVFAERIARDGGRVARNILWKATHKGALDFLPAGALDQHVDSIFKDSKLAQYIDGVSPTEAITGSTRVSRIGEGGITDMHSAPDEMRLVQNSFLGFIDPVKTPESAKVGLDSYFASGVRKGTDGLLYARFYNPRTKTYDWVDSRTAALANIATGEFRDSDDNTIPVARGGSGGIKLVPRNAVDYYMDKPSRLFSYASSMVPGISGTKGMRLNMGSKVFDQALPLVNREAPLVQSLDDESGRSYEELLGDKLGTVKASTAGIVSRVAPDHMEVLGNDGRKVRHELYNNFYANQKGILYNIPTVREGDRVAPGQLIAHTNYTDKTGTAAGGTNLRVGFMSYMGENYEDGIVVSENAARKLSAEIMHKHILPKSGIDINKQRYLGTYPGRFTREQIDKIGDDGFIKPGATVAPGDPIALAVKENEPGPGTLGRRSFTDSAETWTGNGPGTVRDIVSGKDNHKVYISEEKPLEVGDKITGRYGNKGVVGHIIREQDMPAGEDGKPLEILMSPLGTLSRTNPAALIEAARGKIAARQGRPYKMPNFTSEDYVESTMNELKKNGLSDTETVYNPLSGRKIPGIMTGNSYFYRLKHTAESKEAGRGAGSESYTAEGQPASGGYSGSKKIGTMEMSALVGHGAYDFIKDAKLVRGQSNDDFWRDFRMGKTPAMPDEPLIHRKFLAHLQGSGINVNKTPSGYNIFGMTGKQAEELSGGRELQSSDSYDMKTFRPIDKGLFGQDIFGQDGRQWAYIKLDEPLPNPVMADSLRRILNLSAKDYDAVCEGRLPLGGGTGGRAIGEALAKVDLDAELARSSALIKASSGDKRDKAIKRFRALASMKEQGTHPADFMMDRVPVLPPAFRPIMQNDGITMVADANYLYKKLLNVRDDAREVAAMPGMPQETVAAARAETYRTYKELAGLSDPDDAKLVNKNVGGLLQWVFGSNPKTGVVQRKIIGTAVDTVGRGTITPNPALKLNQLGLPENQAWEIYEPFIVRHLVQQGFAPTDAIRKVAGKDAAAYRALQDVVKDRPVVMNRAPSHHKFSMMGFWPVLTKGNTIQTNPSIVVPFGADFDGDSVNLHVPVGYNAKQDVINKMLPERNLKDIRKFQVQYKPEKEYAQGLWLATRRKPGPAVQRFRTVEEARAAYKAGTIDPDDPIDIKEIQS